MQGDLVALVLDAGIHLTGQHLYALFTMLIVDELGKVGRK